MSEVSDRIRNTPPTKIKDFLPKGYKSTIWLSASDPLKYSSIELVCRCAMDRIDWVAEKPPELSQLVFHSIHAPRNAFHFFGRYFWLLTAGICPKCQTLYWRTDPLQDDWMEKPTIMVQSNQ